MSNRNDSLLEIARRMQKMIQELNDHEGAEGWSEWMPKKIDELLNIDLDDPKWREVEPKTK